MAGTFIAQNDVLARTTSLPSSAAFTICGWALRLATDVDETVFGLTDTSGNKLWIGRKSSDGTIGMIQSIAWSWTEVPILAAQLGIWYFMALTSDGGRAAGYAAPFGGGLRRVSLAYSAITPTALVVGLDNDIGQFHGRIADVRVWDAALSLGELLAESQSRAPVRLRGLHLWSPFANGPRDYSGKGRDWTQAGGVLYGDGGPPLPTFQQAMGSPIWWGKAPAYVPPGTAPLGSFDMTMIPLAWFDETAA